MEFLKQLLALTWLVSLIAFIVYWRKKASARKSAGENYKDDENYKNISKTKRIIGVVCIASFVILGAINSNSNSGSSSYSSSSREIEQKESVKKMNEEYQKKYNKTDEEKEAERQAREQEKAAAEAKKYAEAAEANIDTLLDDVKSNAAKANKNYNGKYVKIVGGIVQNIESNARYISLRGSNPYDIFINVQCYPKNSKVKDAMIELSKGQQVTVYGKITDVGEIMGYQLDMDKVE